MNTLPHVIKHCYQRVLTTRQLAQHLETDENNIQKNYSRNKDHFVLGEDYFLLEGDDLENFKELHLTFCQAQNLNMVRSLYVWTEFGTLLHVKSIGTDKAWQIYKWLRRDYYDRGEQLAQLSRPQVPNMEEIQAAYTLVQAAKEQLEQVRADANRRIAEATTAYGQAQARFHELIEPLGELGKALAPRALGQRKKPLKQSSAKFVQMDSDETATAGPPIEDILSSYMQSVGKPLTTRDILRCGPPPIRKLKAKEVQDLLGFLEQSGVVSTERKGKVLWYTFVS